QPRSPAAPQPRSPAARLHPKHQTDQWHNHFYYNGAILKSFSNFYYKIFNIFIPNPYIRHQPPAESLNHE
ncbi:MAG: hypothetical protein LBK60_09405, partial [Verrucomicrobiales bacterium]|nr:hypothetical protein [Verrucomicrobiales bacterium]